MEKTSPYRDWVIKNYDYIEELLDSKYITEEDIQKLANADNKYPLREQEAAFKKFNEKVNETFSDERVKGILENEDDDKDFWKKGAEFRKSMDSFVKKDTLLSSKLIEEINNSNYKNNQLLKGLAEQVKGMSDKDLREYLWVSRSVIDNRMTKPMLDALPSLEKYIREEPTFGVEKKDYDKMFGVENALDKAFDGTLNYKDVEYRARQNGMTGKQLMNQMTKDKIDLDRKRIAHGEDLGGWLESPESFAHNLGGSIMGIFGRRQREAVERGDDITTKDILGDAGEQALYMVPMGKVVQAASVPAKAAWTLGSAAVVPTLSEIYDHVVYPDDNPRGGSFITEDGSIDKDKLIGSGMDIALGTGTNLAAPYGLRMLGRLGRRASLDNFARPLAELGEGETAKEASERVKSSFGNIRSVAPEERIKLPGKEWEASKEASDLFRTNPRKWSQINVPPKDAKATLFDIASVKGKPSTVKMPDGKEVKKGESLYTKYEAWLKKNKLPKDTPINEVLGWGSNDKSFISEEAMKMYNDLGLNATEGLSSKADLVKSDALKNYLTNQFGNFTYGDQNINLPFLSYGSMFGVDLNKNLREMKEKKKRDKAIEEAEKKYQSKIQDIYNFK